MSVKSNEIQHPIDKKSIWQLLEFPQAFHYVDLQEIPANFHFLSYKCYSCATYSFCNLLFPSFNRLQKVCKETFHVPSCFLCCLWMKLMETGTFP